MVDRQTYACLALMGVSLTAICQSSAGYSHQQSCSNAAGMDLIQVEVDVLLIVLLS